MRFKQLCCCNGNTASCEHTTVGAVLKIISSKRAPAVNKAAEGLLPPAPNTLAILFKIAHVFCACAKYKPQCGTITVKN